MVMMMIGGTLAYLDGALAPLVDCPPTAPRACAPPMLCCTVLYCAVLCAVLCYTVLCCVLCCAVCCAVVLLCCVLCAVCCAVCCVLCAVLCCAEEGGGEGQVSAKKTRTPLRMWGKSIFRIFE